MGPSIRWRADDGTTLSVCDFQAGGGGGGPDHLSPTYPSVFGVCDMATLKPTYNVLACEQLRRRPACASAQLLFAIVLLASFKTSRTPKTGLLTLFCPIIIKLLDSVAIENKGADQPAQQRSLASAFVIRYLKSSIVQLHVAPWKMSIY